MSTLVFEKKETLDPITLEWVLVFASKIAVTQHTKAVIADSEKKMVKTSNSNLRDFPLWFMMRVQRIEYKQSQNLTKEEREIMRTMRGRGESLRDIAYILDRSVSTVHQNCQDVEVVDGGGYY